MAALEHGVLLSKTSPAFLHANSTSHTWTFSAFAEIIDNAYDPDVHASVLRIDTYSGPHNTICLAFTDNGAGMTPEKLHKMLSFGYCEKVESRGHKPVGMYGNGFKSGSMRLGNDAMVFTKCDKSISVGFLSQTYLHAIGANTVLVPIITFDKATRNLIVKPEMEGSLKDILEHSIFKTMKTILTEIDNLEGHDTGTRILIYNLKKGGDGMFELDFESNPTDIINSEHHEFDEYSVGRLAREYTSEYRRSLREYCSILFLKPRMKIFLRGEKVKTKLITKSLRQTEVDIYRPKFLSKPVRITFGFGPCKEDCGMMLYHRNRLIKAYERVGVQKQQNGQGLGVVGVVEVDFLDPIHNKQDFNKTDRYNACISALGYKLNDYWQEKTNATEIDVERLSDDWTWVQCDNPLCLKWRRLPEGTEQTLPDKWFCYMNRDPTHNRCDIEEEPEDEDALLQRGATYAKTVKRKRTAEQMKKVHTIQQREEEVRQKEEELIRVKQEIELLQPLPETPDASHRGPTLADLQQATKELEEARKREEEQMRIIQQLQEQKAEMERQQKRIGDAIMSDAMSRETLNNIATNGITDSPSVRRKRKDSSEPSAVPRKRSNTVTKPDERPLPVELHDETSNTVAQLGDGITITMRQESDTEDEMKSPATPAPSTSSRLLVKFPPPTKKPSDVIVINSDDEECSTEVDNVKEEEDIKPDVKELDENANGGAGSAEDDRTGSVQKSKTKDSESESRKSRLANKGNREKTVNKNNSASTEQLDTDISVATSPTRTTSGNQRTANKSRSRSLVGSGDVSGMRKLTTETATQTDDERRERRAEFRLRSLRENVARLLHVILPDIPAFSNIPLENVDESLIQVLKVNESEENNRQTGPSVCNNGNMSTLNGLNLHEKDFKAEKTK